MDSPYAIAILACACGYIAKSYVDQYRSSRLSSSSRPASVSESSSDENDESGSGRNEASSSVFSRQKLVLVVNGGLISGGKKKRMMQEGKMAAQCCHAAVACCSASSGKMSYKVWSATGGAKIVLKTNPSEEWVRETCGGDAVDESENDSRKKKTKRTKTFRASPDDHLAYMRHIQAKARAAGLTTYLVADAGHTQLTPGTITVLGIGPDSVEKIDAITGRGGCLSCKLVQ